MKADKTGFIPIKIIFLGLTNVGKTSIIERYVSNSFPFLHDITVGIDISIKSVTLKNLNLKLEIWDTFGIESGRAHAVEYAKKADAAVFVMDISRRHSMERLKHYIEEYKKHHTIDNGIIIGNKTDKSHREITLVEGETFANEYHYDYFELSSKMSDSIISIYDAMNTLVRQVLQRAKLLNEKENEEEMDQYHKSFIHSTIETLINKVTELFSLDDFFTYLINDLNEYFRSHISSQRTPKNFEELKEIIIDVNLLSAKLLSCLKISSMTIDAKTNEQNPLFEKFFSSIVIVKDAVCHTIYHYQLAFIRSFLSVPPSDKLAMILIEKDDDALESLQVKKKEVLCFFDNAFIKYHTAKDLHEYFQFKAQVERIITQRQQDILSLIKGNEIKYYQQRGNEMMTILKQYRNAFNDRWDKVQLEEIKKLNFYQIEEKIHYYGYKCYINYKTAYQYADKDPSHINEQVRLRAKVSLAYSRMGYHLKANFYVLAANLAICNNPSLVNKEEIDYVIKVGTKISYGLYDDTKTRFSVAHNPDLPFDEKGNNTPAVNTVKRVNSELKNIHFNREVLQKLDEQKEEQVVNIKELKMKIYKNIFLGLSYQDKEFSLKNDSKQSKDEHLRMNMNERSVSKYLYWLVIPGLIAFGVMKLFDKFIMTKQLKQFQIACDKLTKIYSSALNLFKRRQYSLFLEALGEPYREAKSLITYSKDKIFIEPAEILMELLKYGFKPDDIAQLMNLIGISLLSLCGLDFKRNKKLAITVFNAGLDINLIREAEMLDKKMKKQLALSSNETPFKSSIEEIRNSIRINLIMLLVLKDQKKVNEFMKEVENSIQRMKAYPFSDQLEVSKDVISALYGRSFYQEPPLDAMPLRSSDVHQVIGEKGERFNVAFFSLKAKAYDEFDLFTTLAQGKYQSNKGAFISLFEYKYNSAKNADCDFMKDILKSEETHSFSEWKYFFNQRGSIFKVCYMNFFSKYFNMRMQIYSLATEVVNETEVKLFKLQSVIQLCSTVDIVLHLCVSDDKENELELIGGFVQCNKLGEDYEQQVAYADSIAEAFPDIANRIHRGCVEHYSQSDPKQCPWFYYESLIKLSLYKEIVTSLGLMENPSVVQLRYLSLAERKLGNIHKSVSYLKIYRRKEQNESIGLFNDILQEMLKIKNMEKDIVKYYDDLNAQYQEIALNGNEQSEMMKRSDSTYKILSLDGGGIRCIIQLIILCEIELRTKKPISKLFDMIIGTSTGAFIAACLCIEGNDSKEPKYKAFKILELLMNHQESLFYEEDRDESMGRYKYSRKKKEHLFKQIFAEKQVSHSLVDLAFPVYNTVTKEIVVFQSSKEPQHKFTDLLMASTATPTLFPSVRYNDMELADASVSAFNPALMGVKTAKANSKDMKKAKVFSMGSGYYPLMPEEIYWKDANGDCGIEEIANFNTHVISVIGENYIRIQLQLPSPIGLDSLESFNQLVELTRDYLIEAKLTGKLNTLISQILA